MDSPKVSIITRTRNRPLLLQRALHSVLGQENAPPWEWIVVNDGGGREEVERILLPAGDRVTIKHLKHSQGMEHASNCGISLSSGKYLAIHDDDDSWDSGFLREMHQWLDLPGRESYAGVVCHSIRVQEHLTDSEIKILREEPFNFWVEEILPWNVLMENPFPPISFLFRKSAYSAAGPFDESLPVLGDWEFNIRLVLRWRIGVLKKPLARYHHRDPSAKGAIANSITEGHDRHRQWEKTLRNRWLTHPPLPGIPHFGELSKIAGAIKTSRDALDRLLSLPMRPGPQV